MKELRDVIVDLKGTVPEPVRATLARRLARLIGEKLAPEVRQEWYEREQIRFLLDCQLEDPQRWVPEDLKIEPTRLAQFCKKWMTVSAFKMPEEGEDKWRPITPEQNGLRVAMIQELKSISESDLRAQKI